MKTLALLLVVALATAVTLAYDSHESHESYERYEFAPRGPWERQRETCEEYNPCERYAMRHGWGAAYKRYFGQRAGGRY
ncbi:unnamed protein product [Ranitomeya imitator]|uniref:Matrix Gla protein n=1 Tax=Ranitomeya imitator TaxID=111125 RepID=A0ABN9L8X1_9NEOB|nr:unnamed protein product [Ranitomeya imitator]